MKNSVEEITKSFFSQFKQYSYKKGEILIRADDTPSGVFYLEEGRVKMYAISKKGEEVILTIFKQGSFFPMNWALNNTPNPYFFEALDDITVLKASPVKVEHFLMEHPEVMKDLLRRVYRGLDGLLVRMAHLMGGSAYLRLTHEILIHAERFGKKDEANQIVLDISEVDLAKQTGLTRETVSREIRHLKNKGIVELSKNQLIIKDNHAFLHELEEF